MATVHYRVRGVKCGKCDKIHNWYKYRVWRDGKKIREEYVGKCDEWGNLEHEQSRRTHYHQTNQKQPPPKSRQKRVRSPYEVLGVSYYATDAQIKAAYKKLVKQYHPDVNPHVDHQTIAEINVAYNLLMKR